MSFIPAGRREVNVRRDGNCSYRAMAPLLMEKPTMLIQFFEPCVLK